MDNCITKEYELGMGIVRLPVGRDSSVGEPLKRHRERSDDVELTWFLTERIDGLSLGQLMYITGKELKKNVAHFVEVDWRYYSQRGNTSWLTHKTVWSRENDGTAGCHNFARVLTDPFAAAAVRNRRLFSTTKGADE
ncbi:hypothetical protein LSAT2_014153 [Lamellibrachia satsuma]|nr:hypothetical protein LSAT2_014153 [Lamellibrachia satsuma]